MLEDSELFQTAVNDYRHGIGSQIAANGGLPRELRRAEKSGTYTLMVLEAMVQAVHIGEHHGYTDVSDLKSNKGGTIQGKCGSE